MRGFIKIIYIHIYLGFIPRDPKWIDVGWACKSVVL